MKKWPILCLAPPVFAAVERSNEEDMRDLANEWADFFKRTAKVQ
jgi:hypothetical protein